MYVRIRSHLQERRQARQQHLGREERRDVQTNHVAAITNAQLLGDRFESCEHRLQVLQITLAGFGQRQRTRTAFEQCDAELLLEPLI